MSVFEFLNSTLQVLQNVSLLNNKVNSKKYIYGRNIDHKYISITISTDSCICLKYFNLQNKICRYK